jgi:hypothetical protein
MIAALLRYAPLRTAPLLAAPPRVASQLNAPLGSLEPLLRLRGAERHQAHRGAPRRIAPHRNASLRSAPPRHATRRSATQLNAILKGTRNDTD